MIGPAVLFLLIAASVGYFSFCVRRRFAGFFSAVPKIQIEDASTRVWRVVSEVLLQSRVIRDRPLAGLMHALVMWGFLAFAWVSVEHFYEGFRGLEHAEAGDSWYGAFAAVWAVLVTVGIVYLAFRRFVLRPKALGEKFSAGSAIVAALIVLLMVTYLVGWRGLEVGSPEWVVNWWLHAGAFLGMLWVIPNSKHLHLFLGPFGVFLRSETTSATRALREEDDEDFGMIHFSDLSQKDLLDVNACVECGRCTEVCPANVIGGSLNPKEIILQTQRGLLKRGFAGKDSADRIAGSAEEVSGGQAWIAEGDLYQCLSCGACEQACPVGIEHVGAKILDLRRGLVSEGRTHSDRLTDMFTTMERSPHNAWGASQDTRRKLVEGDGFPIFDGSQEWLFWLGCGCNYDPHGNDVARAVKKIFEAAGISWGVLARETCCGEPARRAGNEYLYMELSEKVIEALAGKKVKNIVTSDPHCTRMFDSDYRQNSGFEGLGIRVLHHTELLESLLPSLKLKPSHEAVTYHDPCYLARGRGVTDAPRSILAAAGVELNEMARHGKQTFCCGAGGAQLYIADDKAEYPGGRVNHQRFEQALETGVEKIAAACPYCPIMLKDAAVAAGREGVQVVDVAEILAARL